MAKKWLWESELALKAASTSAQLIEERGLDSLAFKIKKSPRDLVTELDIIIEERAKGILGTSGYQIIGEETTKSNILDIDPQKPTWFIDPIDGTTNLISAIPFYATSIGLVVNSKFLLGAVVLPALKEIFFTIGNQGSFMNGEALTVKAADLENSLIAASFSVSRVDETKRKKEYEFFGMLNDMGRGCLRLGSAATNVCYVACGRLQAAYGINNKIWDIAGALPVALQSGCHVYLEWDNRSIFINYVVGVPGVAEEVAALVNKEKLANVIMISLSE